MSISVVINTLNEEQNIKRAVESVKKFADEVIVVDMESDDNTAQIAKKLGAKVHLHKKTNYVEPARNFAISKAIGDWILILDADEELTPSLISNLRQIVESDNADFVRIPRKNMIFGKWMQYSRWWPDYNIRFFKKNFVTWENEIHSVPVTTGRGLDLKEHEDLAIIHHHYENVEQYIDRLNRYTTVQSKELQSKGRDFKNADLIQRPMSEFLSRYFAGQGYKDGVHGLAISLLQSLSELVVYVKLWQLSGFKEDKLSLSESITEINKSQKELNYWKAHAQVQEGGGLSARVKRKLKM